MIFALERLRPKQRAALALHQINTTLQLTPVHDGFSRSANKTDTLAALLVLSCLSWVVPHEKRIACEGAAFLPLHLLLFILPPISLSVCLSVSMSVSCTVATHPPTEPPLLIPSPHFRSYWWAPGLISMRCHESRSKGLFTLSTTASLRVQSNPAQSSGLYRALVC